MRPQRPNLMHCKWFSEFLNTDKMDFGEIALAFIISWSICEIPALMKIPAFLLYAVFKVKLNHAKYTFRLYGVPYNYHSLTWCGDHNHTD